MMHAYCMQKRSHRSLYHATQGILNFGYLSLRCYIYGIYACRAGLPFRWERDTVTIISIKKSYESKNSIRFDSARYSFEVTWNVSKGSIKWSAWQAHIIEDDHGYFDYWINETTVEKVQTWFYEGNNGTAGYIGDSVNEI
jgi:hypothetical protein